MISVVIPTINAGSVLEQLLSSLTDQTINADITVIDSSSNDETMVIATRYGARNLIVDRNNFNHGQTRNIGIRQTVCDIAVFLTQDALPVDNFCLENLIKPLKDPQITASFGRQLALPNASPTEYFTRFFNYPEKPIVKGKEDLPRLGIKTFFFSNVCSAIKTKEFNELGGFPENIIMFEDLIFAAKAIMKGYKIAYVPDAKVWHSHNFSLLQQFCRYQDAGISLRNNSWVFEQVKTNREGVEFLKQQIDYLHKMHKNKWIPYAIAESFFKFAGFWFGMHGINPRKKKINITSVPSKNA